MLEYNEIRERKIILYEDEPCEVMESHVARTQQRKPQNQVKLKSLLSGRTWNATFHTSDKADEVDLTKKDVKFLYSAKDEFWFCDPTDPKNRFKIDSKVVGDSSKFLKPDGVVTSLVWDNDGEDQVIKVTLPIKMEFVVKEAPPSIRGNTANGGGKVATLENDYKLTVPFFVEVGDRVIINTETGEYVERIK